MKAPAKRTVYQRQWRVLGTEKWNPPPSSLQSKTTITGLPVGKYVELRFRFGTKTGEGDWSEPIFVLVK